MADGHLHGQVVQVLAAAGMPLLAREIASRIAKTGTEANHTAVNRVLYGPHKHLFFKDSKHRWSLATHPSSSASHIRSRKPAELPEYRVDLVGSLTNIEDNVAPVQGLRAIRTRFLFDLDRVTFAPVDVLVSLLFLSNQLVAEAHEVVLQWKNTTVRTYADRIGFFHHLAEEVSVLPKRPDRLYKTYLDNNEQILEMTGIIPGDDRGSADDALRRLDRSLRANLNGVADDATFSDIWTFASEALDNVFEHSETKRSGIVVAQRYVSKTYPSRLRLVIADAGLGIPHTLRKGNLEAKKMSDRDLLLTAFRDGLSRRTEKGHGCGLTGCARVATRYQANLTVRVGHVWAKLVTRSAKSGISMGIFKEEGVSVDGTQIALDLYLDRFPSAR